MYISILPKGSNMILDVIGNILSYCGIFQKCRPTVGHVLLECSLITGEQWQWMLQNDFIEGTTLPCIYCEMLIVSLRFTHKLKQTVKLWPVTLGAFQIT